MKLATEVKSHISSLWIYCDQTIIIITIIATEQESEYRGQSKIKVNNSFLGEKKHSKHIIIIVVNGDVKNRQHEAYCVKVSLSQYSRNKLTTKCGQEG